MAGRLVTSLSLFAVVLATSITEPALPESLEATESLAAVEASAASGSSVATPDVAYNTVSIISNSQVQLVIDAAVKKANEIKQPSNIAVSDPFGHLISFLRMDGAVLASIDVALKKAKTVSMFGGKYRTGDLYNATGPSGTLFGIQNTNSGLVFFGGGVPLKTNGQFIGSIGVSGGTVQQDSEIAAAAAAVLK